MPAQNTLRHVVLCSFRDDAPADADDTVVTDFGKLKEASPGSLAYEAFGTEDPTTFYIEESWSSREDVDRHARRVETDGYVERSVDLLATPLATVTLLEI